MSNNLVQELQFNCGKVDIFIDVYSGEKIPRPDQLEIAETLKDLGGLLDLPAGRIKIIIHDLGRGVSATAASAQIFGKFCAYTASAEISSRAKIVSGVIGSCLIALKACLEAREQITENGDGHDPVMGKIGDPVPVDEILRGFERDRKKGQN